MDYPFFVAPIHKLRPETHAALASSALGLRYDPFPSLPALDHTDYHPHSLEFKAACMELHRELGLFADSQIVRFTVTKLRARTIADEHSDYYVKRGSADNMRTIIAQHKVHVPLITNEQAFSLHRRTQRMGHDSFHMPIGYAYAYNDIAWHKIANGGDTDRYHLIVFYKDADLTVKKALLERLNIDYTRYYEDTSYAYPFAHSLSHGS